MNPHEVRLFFSGRKDRFRALEEKFSRRHLIVSYLRALSFVVGLVLVVYYINMRAIDLAIAAAAAAAVVFGVLVKIHNRIAFSRDFHKALREINDEEIRRQDFQLRTFDEGAEFIDDKHHYATDLDIFGASSVFQALNRTSTPPGRSRLAEYLKGRSKPAFIKDQQKAVEELAADVDWQQEFHAAGRLFREAYSGEEELVKWAKEPPSVKNKGVYRFATWSMPLLTLSAIAAAIFAGASWNWVLAPVLINFFFIYKFNAVTQQTYEKTNKGYKILKAFEALIAKLEESRFSSRRLTDLKAAVIHADFKASRAIRRLQRILNRLEARGNLYYHVLNPVLLLDLSSVLRAETWKTRYGALAEDWFRAIAEAETINSLAGFKTANPDYVFPTLTEDPHRLSATSLAHPLIKREVRVANDFEFSAPKQITLVTGSNMSGKSTFLRTVGVNAVLALMGAPVCAQKLELSCFDIFTSMRTQDNLEENVSSFYAELARIRSLIQYIDEGRMTLFMLDEILKGTNSRDRHRGAAALARQLSKMNASGFISTHDLELCALEDEITQIRNYSFESELKNDELVFDYKLKKGVAGSFNASILMSKMGIEIE